MTRAHIVLAAAEGESNAGIAASLGVCEDTARKWRGRCFAAPGVASLGDANGWVGHRGSPRYRSRRSSGCLHATGRRRVADGSMVLPGTCLSRRCRGDLCVHLDGDDAPMAVRGCPQTLAVPVVDLHHRPRLRGQASGCSPLRPEVGRETIGGQRLCHLRRREDLHPGPCRCQPTLPPGNSRTIRVNHAYDRGGAVAYLAAYDVHRAKVLAAAKTPPASNRSAD